MNRLKSLMINNAMGISTMAGMSMFRVVATTRTYIHIYDFLFLYYEFIFILL